MADKQNISLSAFRITVIYLVVAALWIAFTDQILNALISDSEHLSTLQTYKGWFYVIVTSLGLFFLVKKHEDRLKTKEHKLEDLLDELRSEKELKDILFERIPVLITIYDPDLEEFEVNQEFEKTVGWTNEEIKKQDIDLLKACYPNSEEREAVVKFMDSPGVGWKEFTMSTKSGDELPTSWTNIKLTDNTSVGIGIDMTEIKANQAKIRESRKLLRKTFESLEESVIIVDPEERTIVDCNKGTEKNFGYNRNELIGASTRKLHLDDTTYEKFNEIGAESLEEHGVFQTDFVMRRKDGSTFYSGHTVTLVHDDNGNVDRIVSVIRDITEQKKYQRELEERNEFIETTIDNLPIGVAVNTIDEGRATLMNKEFSEIYGWPQDVLKNVETFFEKVYPDEEYRAEIIKQVQADIESGNPEQMRWEEIKITTQEGEERIVNAKNIPLYDQNLMISTVVNVTEQKKLEEELKKEKQRFELVANTTSDVIWDLDVQNEKLWWSDSFEEIFGYETKDPEQNFTEWSDYVHPEDRENIIKSSDQKLDSNAREWEEEYRIIKADGSIAHIIDRALILRNDEQEAIRMVGAMDDITERKRAQQKLSQSEEKYRHIFENNPEPMWIYNPETLEFVEVNRAAINHYGYSREEFLNMSLLEIRPKKDVNALQKNVRQNKGKKSYSEEWTHLKKDGTKIQVKVSAADIKYNGAENFRLVLINDVTEQKRMQEKIIQSIIQGEDRERKRIAHELHDGLGQYLVAANMNFQSVQSEVDSLPEKRKKQFQTGLSHLKKALSETRTIAHNLMPKAIADYGLISALENLIADFRNSTDITFEFDHNGEDLELSYRAEINIYRIMQEITSNAVRHSECSTISIKLHQQGDTLQLKVVDDGIGIELTPKEEQKGLGLQSIKTRVNSLNGNLNIESEPGEGMKVSITFPNISQLQSNGDT